MEQIIYIIVLLIILLTSFRKKKKKEVFETGSGEDINDFPPKTGFDSLEEALEQLKQELLKEKEKEAETKQNLKEVQGKSKKNENVRNTKIFEEEGGRSDKIKLLETIESNKNLETKNMDLPFEDEKNTIDFQLDNEEELRKAIIYSEIFNKKYI